jgi:uncharacterized membrane protein (DUF106 family)
LLEERAITIKYEEATNLKMIGIEKKLKDQYLKGVSALEALQEENLVKENAMRDKFEARIEVLQETVKYDLETLETKQMEITDLREQFSKYYTTY